MLELISLLEEKTKITVHERYRRDIEICQEIIRRVISEPNHCAVCKCWDRSTTPNCPAWDSFEGLWRDEVCAEQIVITVISRIMDDELKQIMSEKDDV